VRARVRIEVLILKKTMRLSTHVHKGFAWVNTVAGLCALAEACACGNPYGGVACFHWEHNT